MEIQVSLGVASGFIDSVNTINTKADKITSYVKSEVDKKYYC